MTDQKPKVCGGCTWVTLPENRNKSWGLCKITGLGVNCINGTCPAHDDGKFDEAVRELLGKIHAGAGGRGRIETDGPFCEAVAIVNSMLAERKARHNK